jgi:chromate transporter
MNTPKNQRPSNITLKEAFLYWLKLGFISFGGPAGQISMMHQELVEKRRWISEHRFLHALNYTMVLPGPEAQQLATYIGWLMHGVKGGIMAGVLFVLPSLFILIGLTWLYLAYSHIPAIAGILYGIKPAVTAIVLFAAYRIGSKALKNNVLHSMAALAFIAIFFAKLPFPLIVLSAGFLGLLGARFAPQYFNSHQQHGSSINSYGLAIIDDDTPVPEHATFSKNRLGVFISVGAILFLSAILILLSIFGWHGTYTQMGYFFSKAALLTFGGAYAVLPYVYQGGVESYHWLTATQMIDGLALGETTPGPLIMIVAFVGFVGGWSQQVFGADQLLLAGSIGALVATFFTFLPSFLFILIGGPAVEASRHDIKFTAPLTGITAAVVGVILNLAVFFAYHILWPQGFNGVFEWPSALISIVAFIALWKWSRSVVQVIALSAIAGLAIKLLI